MTINDEILILANQIANRGHKPTVALIKTKLSTKVPLPVIISALKGWQHDPTFIALPEDKKSDTVIRENSASINKSTFENELSKELATMKEEIAELKALVKKLISQS
jgi:hypothetical protein